MTYRLSGVDASSFDIGRGTGQITVGYRDEAGLRDEADTYTVTVTATDPSNESASIIVTIKVTDVNERPELSKKALVVSGRTKGIDHPENDRSTVATYTAAGPRAGSVLLVVVGRRRRRLLHIRRSAELQGHAQLREPGGPGHGQRIQHNGKSQKRGLHRHAERDCHSGQCGRGWGRFSVAVPSASLGVELTASLTDPDGRSGAVPPITSTETNLTDDAAWQWAWSPDGDSGWTNIVGATSNTYTPVQADQGAYLRATASYTDAQGFGKRAIDVTTQIAAVAPDGRVTLSSSRPEVGLGLTASLTDPDGGVTGLDVAVGQVPERDHGLGRHIRRYIRHLQARSGGPGRLSACDGYLHRR